MKQGMREGTFCCFCYYDVTYVKNDEDEENTDLLFVLFDASRRSSCDTRVHTLIHKGFSRTGARGVQTWTACHSGEDRHTVFL